MPIALPPDLPLPPPVATSRVESPAPAPADAPGSAWEGAIGLNFSNRPEYSGADSRTSKVSPALFLRYGRFTITNASGFVTRKSNDVVRGLGADLLNNDRVRVNLALRFDNGRSEGDSTALTGLGDIKPTVRARLNLGWRLPDGWRAGASWSVDAFGRGGGNFGDVSLGWDHRLGPRTTLGLGTSLSFAGDRYMQTYYGVSAEQAARTPYAVYTPNAGLRDISASVNFRTELGDHWILLTGLGVTRLLGPAASSPYSAQPNSWSFSSGLAYRF